MPLDQNKIPELSKLIHSNYFAKTERLPFVNSVLLFNFYISKILCHNRVKISVPKMNILTFPNIFLLIIGESGSGRDRSRKTMDEMVSFMYSDKDEMEKQYRKQKEYELEKEADKEGMKGGKRIQYIKENMPRSMFSRIKSTSTPEGLSAVHENLSEAGFGEITWIDGEIGDTMARWRAGSTLDDIITACKEAYDNGTFEAKIIKGNKTVKAHGKIPYLALLHGAIDERAGKEVFMKFMAMGYGRRCLFYLNEHKNEDNRTDEETEKELAEAYGERDFFVKNLKEIYERTKINLAYSEEFRGKIFTLSPEATKKLIAYQRLCENESLKMGTSLTTVVRRERAGRWWKALKLSCVFAVQNHTGEAINVEDIDQAINFCDHLGEYLLTFVKRKTLDEISVAEGIIEALEKEPVGLWRTDFYSMPFFPKFRSGQRKIFDENILIARELANLRGQEIIENQTDKRGGRYKMVKLPEEKEVMAYIKVNGVLSQLTADVLSDRFGEGVKVILERNKVQKRTDGGYYLSN